MIKGPTQQKDVIFYNIYTANTGTPEILKDTKGEIAI